MKINLEDNKMIIFLNKLYLKKNNFDVNEPQRFLKSVLKKIRNKYAIDFNGYYNIDLYIDNIYGIVINIEKEDLEYFDFDGQMEYSVKIIESEFLYELCEIVNKSILKRFIIYKNKDKFYLKPKEYINDKEMGLILENAKIIYNKKAKEIISVSKIVRG